MTDFYITEGSFVENRENLNPILRRHYEETDKDKEAIPLDLDWETYKNLEDVGILKTIFAMDGDKIVGYNVNMIMPALHYKSVVFCVNDIIYVLPEYRSKNLAGKMIEYAEEKYPEEHSVSVFHYGSKSYMPKVGRFFEKMGYEHYENVYQKVM